MIAEPEAERMGWSSCMTLWITGLVVMSVGGLDLTWTRSINASDK